MEHCSIATFLTEHTFRDSPNDHLHVIRKYQFNDIILSLENTTSEAGDYYTLHFVRDGVRQLVFVDGMINWESNSRTEAEQLMQRVLLEPLRIYALDT